jgi:hypothetical protein
MITCDDDLLPLASLVESAHITDNMLDSNSSKRLAKTWNQRCLNLQSKRRRKKAVGKRTSKKFISYRYFPALPRDGGFEDITAASRLTSDLGRASREGGCGLIPIGAVPPFRVSASEMCATVQLPKPLASNSILHKLPKRRDFTNGKRGEG